MAKDITFDIKLDTVAFQKGLFTALRSLYEMDGSPYGNDDEGLHRWIAEIPERHSEKITKRESEIADVWEK